MTKQEEQILNNIFTHKYYVHGNCIICNKEFETFSNSRSMRTSCCSTKCYKQFRSEQIKRGKEKHHFEVFKDDKYYYIKMDNIFYCRRALSGREWIRKGEKYRHPRCRSPILNDNAQIPNNVEKIIDKISAYLYEKEHIWVKWKTLSVIIKS